MTIAVVADQTLEVLPVDCLRESSTNPRRSFDGAALAELAASVAVHGVQVPLLVRPAFDSTGLSQSYYEIVAGARRYRAAKLAGREDVPCVVRELADDEVREIQIVENLQRADVHPLEEAEAFEELLKVAGSIAAVAQRVGKEQSYVAKRLRLMALTLPSRDALRASLITIDHALLLARLAATEQNAALKWCLDRNAGVKTPVEKVVEERTAVRVNEAQEKSTGEGRYFHHTWEPESVVRLKAWMEAESGILLSRAPWSLTEEDYLLPDVGPCSECPKNTRANSPLFGDLQMGEATCTDGACFTAKTAGFVQIAQRKAGHDELAKPKVLVPQLSWKSSSVKPSIVPGPMIFPDTRTEIANPAKVLKYGQWIDAKPGSCPNVRLGVTADWSDAGDRGYTGGTKKLRKPGEVLNICIAVGCKAHLKGWEKAAPKQQQERRDPEAEKRAQAEQAHVEKVESAIRSTLLFEILGKLDAAKAVSLVAQQQRDANEWRKRLLSTLPELNGERLEALVVFCSEFSNYFRANGYWLMQPGGVVKDRATIFALAKSVGVDAAKVVAKYFHDQGSIAPFSDRLYPKGVPWPKGVGPKGAAAKETAAKKAVGSNPSKTAANSSKAKRVKRVAESKKRIEQAIAKDVAARAKKAAKKGIA